MTQFIINHPFLSIFILVVLTVNIIAIACILTGVWKEGFIIKVNRLKKAVKKKNQVIINLLADISNLEERNEHLSVKGIHQGIEIEMLNDKLKQYKIGAKIMPYVEDMASECVKWLKENLQLKDLLKTKDESLAEYKEAFSKASEQLNSLQNAEKENKDWRILYKQAVAENQELKERIRKNEARIGHKKYLPSSEQKETGWWTPKKDIFDWFSFGEVYEECPRKDGMFSLYLYRKGIKQNYVVNKSDFTPAPVPENNLQNNLQKVAGNKN